MSKSSLQVLCHALAQCLIPCVFARCSTVKYKFICLSPSKIQCISLSTSIAAVSGCLALVDHDACDKTMKGRLSIMSACSNRDVGNSPPNTLFFGHHRLFTADATSSPEFALHNQSVILCGPFAGGDDGTMQVQDPTIALKIQSTAARLRTVSQSSHSSSHS